MVDTMKGDASNRFEVRSACRTIFDVRPGDLDLSGSDRAELHEYIWDTAETEYDARFLFAYLQKMRPHFSDRFWRYLENWRDDEEQHYLGFRHLYCIVFDYEPAEFDRKMSGRSPDFSDLAPFLEDEFTLSTVIAFDELVTTRVYKKEYALYDRLGAAGVSQFLRDVARDEAAHYRDALAIVRECHADRLHEVRAVLDKILEKESIKREYRSTFLLDHTDSDLYSGNLLEDCAHLICRQAMN
ncbi:hypothetical protein [Aestuariispira insulae]|uniref:Rubrerythrin n=1 Tax=Aestuariispira insulae TaxID=1461337 RepID=A0A3D9H5B6_9PROT|nr:hypothetical protein [Aestuariispira insulae]RED44687.1 hypothetical protein DFP90_11449 [Aestuariispira insulae]